MDARTPRLSKLVSDKSRFETDYVTQDGNRYNQVHCRSTSRILGIPSFGSYRFGVCVSFGQFGMTEINSVPNAYLERIRSRSASLVARIPHDCAEYKQVVESECVAAGTRGF